MARSRSAKQIKQEQTRIKNSQAGLGVVKESNKQEDGTESDIVQREGVNVGQQEVGQGEGSQRETAQPSTDTGDSNIGSQEEKVDPFMQSYSSNFEKIIGKATYQWLVSRGDIVVEPLAYMRGTTYDHSIMILDEAQNCTMTQLMLWVTRLGKDSKAIMMGDVSQYDIKKRDSKFLEFIDLISDVEQVNNFKFGSEDIVRNKFLIDIVNKYEKWKSENETK
jgi:phosphate starvation-inducible PhoH-like protein